MIRRFSVSLLALLMLLFLSAACALPWNAAPVIKLGVIAPFEGAGRPLGYAVLPAIKSLVADANASGELAGYRVAVVALDDSLDPTMAAQQARALALDPDVIAVIGPFSEEGAESVEIVLAAAAVPNLPVIATQPAGGDYAGEIAAAREAANRVLRALATDIAGAGRPSRSGLSTKLASP